VTSVTATTLPPPLQAGFDIHEMQHAQCLARSAGQAAVLTRDIAALRKNNK